LSFGDANESSSVRSEIVGANAEYAAPTALDLFCLDSTKISHLTALVWIVAAWRQAAVFFSESKLRLSAGDPLWDLKQNLGALGI
jgi:hypothetical protein